MQAQHLSDAHVLTHTHLGEMGTDAEAEARVSVLQCKGGPCSCCWEGYSVMEGGRGRLARPRLGPKFADGSAAAAAPVSGVSSVMPAPPPDV